MSHPTLIFTPGAWHTPEVFTTLISKLQSHGYKCIALPLQAVASTRPNSPPVKDLQPDSNAVRAAVIQEFDAGNDVIPVAHSWSGIVVGDALDGLGKDAREKEGKKNGVVKIAYMCAFVPPEDVSLVDALGGKEADFYDVQGPWVGVKDPIEHFYHDLPPASAAHFASKLQLHSYATIFTGAKSAAWRTIPSTYLICEDDRAIIPMVQEATVKACQDAGAQMESERIFCSHSPFLVKPDEVVAWLRRAAGENV